MMDSKICGYFFASVFSTQDSHFLLRKRHNYMHANMPLLIFSPDAHSTVCVYCTHIRISICNTHTDGQCRAQASPRNRSIWFWHIFVFSSLRTHCRHSAALKLFWLICFQGFPLIFKPLSGGRLWHPSFTFSMALEKADSEVSPAVFHFRQIRFNFQP